MENKHTPGPWHVASGSVYSETGATIAHMFREPERGNTIRPVERDTNAALIAAAPDMYEALETALAGFTNIGKPGVMSAAMHAIRAALAKATA